jgi:hypothetical protein
MKMCQPLAQKTDNIMGIGSLKKPLELLQGADFVNDFLQGLFFGSPFFFSPAKQLLKGAQNSSSSRI